MAYPQKFGKVWYVYVNLPGRTTPKCISRDPETGTQWTTKTAAREWGREYEAKAKKPQWVDPERGLTTWDQLWEKWNPHGEGDLVTSVDDRTADDYTDLYECHISPRYGGKPIGETLSTEVDGWLAKMRAGTVETGRKDRRRTYKYSPRTTNAIRTLMNTMLTDAVEAQLLKTNPLYTQRNRGTRGKRVDRVQPEVRPKLGVTPEQALAAAVNIHHVVGPGTVAGMGAFLRVLTAGWSGARPGETAALDAGDCRVATTLPTLCVDDEAGNLEERTGQVPRLKNPKSGKGRDLVIPQGLAALLLAWIEYLDGQPKYPDGIMFPDHEGERWKRRYWSRRWNKAAEGGMLALRGSNQWVVAGEYVLERAQPGLEFKGLRRGWNVWATERQIPEIARVHQLGHAMNDEMQATYSQMSAVLEAQMRSAFQDAWTEAFRGYAGIAALGIVAQFSRGAAGDTVRGVLPMQLRALPGSWPFIGIS
jgi:hypothetical protein